MKRHVDHKGRYPRILLIGKPMLNPYKITQMRKPLLIHYRFRLKLISDKVQSHAFMKQFRTLRLLNTFHCVQYSKRVQLSQKDTNIKKGFLYFECDSISNCQQLSLCQFWYNGVTKWNRTDLSLKCLDGRLRTVYLKTNKMQRGAQ